jgi:hypothetical protein
MRLSDAQHAILIALQAGDRLQVHRTLDGAKSYRLHVRDHDGRADGSTRVIAGAIVDGLVRARLIESNMKFPAATFLLTDKGLAAVMAITGSVQTPICSRNFG